MSELNRNIAPPVHPFGHLALQPERVVTASNGIRLHIVADEKCPLTRLCFTGRGGRAEALSPAAALLTAEMLTEGSEEYSPDATAEILDFNGAGISGRSTEHYTRLDLTALPASMDELLPVVVGMMARPRCDAQRLEANRALLASQCAYDLKRMSHLASRAAFALMAGDGHPAACDPRPGDFALPTSEDIAAAVGRCFVAPNMDVYASGSVSNELADTLLRMMESIPGGEQAELNIRPFESLPPQALWIEQNEASQNAVCVALPAVPRCHPDYIPLRLAVSALGGFFGSRLMQNIREDKGLTYGISGSLLGMHEGSYVEISAQCAPDYTDRLIEELRGELLRMASQPLSADELLRMRLYEQTRLAATVDNAIAAGDQYITRLVVGLPDGYFEDTERITSTITTEEIAAVSARYLRPDAMRVVIAGARHG